MMMLMKKIISAEIAAMNWMMMPTSVPFAELKGYDFA